MHAQVRHMDPGAEVATPEGCFLNSLWDSDTDPDASMARVRVPPGVTTRWHLLTDITERYLLVAGAGSVELAELPGQYVGPGDVVIIPPGCRRRITCVGDQDLVLIALCTPRFQASAYRDVDPAPARTL